jgi:hypothetical protein
MIFLTLVLVNKLVKFELKPKRVYLFCFLIYKKMTSMYRIPEFYSKYIVKSSKKEK